MKCIICGKMLDHVDCDCGMCTFCGTEFDAVSIVKSEKN